MEQDAQLDIRIRALANRLYGRVPDVETLPSENNYVCRLHFGASLPDKVIKVGVHLADSVRQEWRVLRLLREQQLAVPAVECTQDDAPNAPWPFFIMPFVGDRDLGDACRERWPMAAAACRQAGSFLVQLHALPAGLLADCALQHYPALTAVDFTDRRWHRVHALLDPGQRDTLTRLHDSLNELLAQPSTQVVHDSFIPAQVQVDAAGRCCAVTDWETIRPGPPLRDVGGFLAGLEAWYGGGPRHAAAFLEGYRPSGTLTAMEAREVAAWRSWYLLSWARGYLETDRGALGADLLQRAFTDPPAQAP